MNSSSTLTGVRIVCISTWLSVCSFVRMPIWYVIITQQQTTKILTYFHYQFYFSNDSKKCLEVYSDVSIEVFKLMKPFLLL